jgi:hypothetical protein
MWQCKQRHVGLQAQRRILPLESLTSTTDIPTFCTWLSLQDKCFSKLLFTLKSCFQSVVDDSW